MATIDFFVPPWGEAAGEALVTKILVESGQPVELEQNFLELATEKVDFELGAPVSGLVGALYVEEGDTVVVGSKVATFYSPDEYNQTEYTIYMAARNLQKLDVNELCTPADSGDLAFEDLSPLFRKLRESARELRGLFLRRLGKNTINELQGTMYKAWSCVNRVRRFQLEQEANSDKRREVVGYVEMTLPDLLSHLDLVREIVSRPRMFIGSSKANAEYANSIRDQIGPRVRSKAWSDDEAFSDPKSTPLPALLEAPARYDYAVFVIGAREDQSRQLLGLRVRDLLICTIGIFLAKLGRDRVRIIKAQNEALHSLEDLVIAQYDPDANIAEEMAKACGPILHQALESTLSRSIEK